MCRIKYFEETKTDEPQTVGLGLWKDGWRNGRSGLVTSSLLFVAVFQRGYPLVALEEFAHHSLVGEVQAVGNFLYGQMGAPQQMADFFQQEFADKLVGVVSGNFFDNAAQVLRRNVEAFGVITDSVVVADVSFQQVDEVGKQLFLFVRTFRHVSCLFFVQQVSHFQEEYLCLVPDDVLGESADSLRDGLVQVFHSPYDYGIVWFPNLG